MSDVNGAQEPAPDAGAGPAAGGGEDQGAAMQPAGGPVLAALQRSRQGPQQSAPGPGNQADALMKIKTAIDLIQQALPGLPSGTPSHTAALRAAQQLSRHIPQGAPTAGVQMTQIMDLLRGVQQNPLLQMLQGVRGVGQGQGGQGGGGQQPQAPMPSTPMPGA
ncbi:MAG TPA: hypothetical protein VHT52_17945 [Stellaceae bacterium]|jgi:hypothetical protein|nr:hypothetical protein [Stellaceae bacterium]